MLPDITDLLGRCKKLTGCLRAQIEKETSSLIRFFFKNLNQNEIKQIRSQGLTKINVSHSASVEIMGGVHCTRSDPDT